MVKPTLEIETDRELQLPHRGAIFNIRNLAIVATLAINAGIPSVVLTKRIHRVVEYIESIHPELCRQPFVDREPLHHREVRVKTRRPMECIASNIANCSATRQCERSRRGLTQCADVASDGQRVRVKQGGNGGEISQIVMYGINIS